MEFVLVCSGIWNMIFAFVKWSLESRNRLLKILCAINGAYLISVGVASIFVAFNDKSILLSFFLSIFVIGALIDFKFHIENNLISIIAILSSIALVACAIGITLFSSSIDDNIYACAILTGCIMLLSTPFEKLDEKVKKH